MPNYVTESSYTEDIPARTFVGDAQDNRTLSIMNLETGKTVSADAPATDARDGKDVARPTRWGMPLVSDDGALAIANARAANNKDRWLVAVDPETGKVRILAVTSQDRLKGAPNFPTAVEAGLPNMVATLFTGLLAPAGTPKPIIDQVYQASQKLMQEPAMQKALTDQGLEPIIGSSPEKMRAFLKEEDDRWRPVLATAGLQQP